MQDNNACLEWFGLHERERILLASFWKQTLPASQNHRMNHEEEVCYFYRCGAVQSLLNLNGIFSTQVIGVG
jgi:hypothetical protein